MGWTGISWFTRQFATLGCSGSAASALPTCFKDNYVLHEMVFKGEFGQVHAAGHVGRKGSKVAVKILDIDGRRDYRYRMAMREAQLQLRVDSENVVRLSGIFSDRCAVQLVMEMCESTLMQELQNAQKDSVFTEAFLMEHVFRGVLSGLVCIHTAGVIHRDLKPAHILFSAAGTPKLCDFSLASIQGDNLCVGAVGTVTYMSPEILGSVGKLCPLSAKTDVWSFGVLAFVLLLGDFPYISNGDNQKLKTSIRTGAERPTFVSRIGPSRASWHAEIFLRSLLVRPHDLRPSAQNALDLLPRCEALSTRPLERVLARAMEVGAFEKGGSEGHWLGGTGHCLLPLATQQEIHRVKPKYYDVGAIEIGCLATQQKIHRQKPKHLFCIGSL